MGKFEEKLSLARVILQQLEKTRLRRTALLKSVIQTCGSPARFDSVFNWLKRNGYIIKAGRGHTDPYRITAKGLRFLSGLINEREGSG